MAQVLNQTFYSKISKPLTDRHIDIQIHLRCVRDRFVQNWWLVRAPSTHRSKWAHFLGGNVVLNEARKGDREQNKTRIEWKHTNFIELNRLFDVINKWWPMIVESRFNFDYDQWDYASSMIEHKTQQQNSLGQLILMVAVDLWAGDWCTFGWFGWTFHFSEMITKGVLRAWFNIGLIAWRRITERFATGDRSLINRWWAGSEFHLNRIRISLQ